MTRRDFSSTLEAELLELFEPHRPDPQAFREGVQKRIAKLRGERGDRENGDEPESPNGERDEKLESRQAPAWVRKVASFFPPDFGALLLSSGKGWSAALLLPALTLGALFGAFFMGKRSIARSVREAAPAPAPPPRGESEAPRNLAQRVGSLMAGSISVLLYVLLWFEGDSASVSVVDVFLLLLLSSILAVTVQIRGASRAGMLDRDTVLGVCGGVLSTMGFGCWFLVFPPHHAWNSESVLGAHAAIAVIIVASFALALRFTDISRLRAISHLAMSGLWFAAFVPVFTLSTPGDIRSFAESQPLDASHWNAWDEVASSVEALRGTGAHDPDLAPMREELERAIRDGRSVPYVVWTAGARTDTIDREHWRLLADRPEHAQRLRALLEEDGPLLWRADDDYALTMLLATRELSDDERTRLTERVVLSWPGPEHLDPLARMKQCVRWFDVLERSELAEDRRAEVHEVLSRCWVRDSERQGESSGGFRKNDHREVSVETTVDAVELIARFGAPSEIDLLRVRGSLRSHAARKGLFSDDDPVRKAPARAALLRLEGQIGLPERSWFEAILAERLLIGVLLLVALCWTAVGSAPPGPEHALRLARERSRR
jgi:hypothetical protein